MKFHKMQNYNTECKSMVNRSEGEWKLQTTEEHREIWMVKEMFSIMTMVMVL